MNERVGDGKDNNAIKVKRDTYNKLISARNKLDKKHKYLFRATMNDVINNLFAIQGKTE